MFKILIIIKVIKNDISSNIVIVKTKIIIIIVIIIKIIKCRSKSRTLTTTNIELPVTLYNGQKHLSYKKF